jgi:photosystem II stability/assembly factor-like uncharacterized protein
VKSNRRSAATRHRPPTRRRFPVAVAALGALVALTAGAWLIQRGDGDQGDRVAGEDPGVTHVHGLGIDPADGTLYAATHHGLFRIPEHGRATWVADRFQDTMGFTVTGPNRFLGSGHPDFSDKVLYRKGRPPHLGLIESTDAGETWTALSLLGEADFHALGAAHGLIYGYNATGGDFMVSPDGKNWDRRSKLRLLSFAVDPANADHALATTETGLAATTDGGRTWRPVPGPALAYLSWDRGGALWGTAADGTVHRSTDQGATWPAQGKLPGAPEALLVHGSDLYAAVSDAGIFRSRDGGRTWERRYSDADRPT